MNLYLYCSLLKKTSPPSICPADNNVSPEKLPPAGIALRISMYWVSLMTVKFFHEIINIMQNKPPY
ncbi:MAG: hypothetical protein AMJ61_11565 [Desulfobacterales bacterium SG8_35_2]|nr:MAG: hypothetical protein AMJ61_11565 [Desulfobacterales bacterium SG8_35_2]